MKNTIIAVLFCALTTITFAQNPALRTPKFKGVEITGTVEQFGSKMAAQGFQFLSKDNNTAIYQGRFAGQDECYVYLVPVENSKDIASVSVMMGLKISDYGTVYSYETWEQLMRDYENMKDLLTEKYGDPSEQNEGFLNGASTSSSYLKLHSVQEGQCDYHATWGNADVDKMMVKLAIVGGRNMGEQVAMIAIVYSNVEKNNMARKEILEDL